MQTFLSWLAGALFAAGFVPYIRGILKGKVRPAKATWIIWGAIDVITCLAMIVEDSANPQIIVAAIGGTIVALLSIRYGKSRWTWVDTTCCIGSALAIGCWRFFNDPIIGLSISLVAMCIGAIPMFRGAWKAPWNENRTAWTLYWVSCIITLFSLKTIDFVHVAQPVAFFIVMSAMVLLIYRVRVRPSL